MTKEGLFFSTKSVLGYTKREIYGTALRDVRNGRCTVKTWHTFPLLCICQREPQGKEFSWVNFVPNFNI